VGGVLSLFVANMSAGAEEFEFVGACVLATGAVDLEVDLLDVAGEGAGEGLVLGGAGGGAGGRGHPLLLEGPG
jgi:hypothetical protein